MRAHASILVSLRHGWVTSAVYYIDMGLCDMNLASLIKDSSNYQSLACLTK